MDFIYNVDLESTFRWREINLFSKIPDVIYSGIGSRVYLYEVQEASFVNGQAAWAFIAGSLRKIFFKAIGCFGDQSGNCCFASSPGPGKEVCVTQTTGGDGVSKCLGDVFLTDNLIKSGRSPFSVEGL
jgi:hypothetical protein